MKLIINRPNWLRGEGGMKSFLLRPIDGRMCCLGFYALACGMKLEEILGAKGFYGCSTERLQECGLAAWLTEYRHGGWYDSRDIVTTMQHNDFAALTPESEAKREAAITSIFAKHGVAVTFTDEPLPEELACRIRNLLQSA